MASYSNVPGNSIFEPHVLHWNRLRFCFNDPKGINFENIIFCMCRFCETNEQKDLFHFSSNGLELQHGDQVNTYQVVRAVEIFLETFEREGSEYCSDFESLGNMKHWHTVLLMHDSMFLCRGVEDLDSYSYVHKTWAHKCPSLDRSTCWIENTDWDDYACVCRKWCRDRHDDNAWSLQLYTESSRLELSGELTITHSMIYTVNIVLLYWLVSETVTGPHQLSILAGTVVQSMQSIPYIGNASATDYAQLKQNREMKFLSQDEIEFSMFLQDHIGQKLVLCTNPDKNWK